MRTKSHCSATQLQDPQACIRTVVVTKLHRTARLRVLSQRRRLAVAADGRQIAGRIAVLAFVVLLEARHNAQIRLALRTMVFGLAAQDATVSIDGVPAKVAAERRSGTDDGTVLRTVLDGELANRLGEGRIQMKCI